MAEQKSVFAVLNGVNCNEHVEKKKTGAQWIHVGLFDNNGRQRGIIKVMEV